MIAGGSVRKAFAWLSLTAVLLLALLPSIGRIAHAHDGAPRMILMEMCTMGSDKLVSIVDPHSLLDDAPRPAPSAHVDMQECGYCPLLAAALLAVLWFAIARLLHVPQRARVVHAFRRVERHPCGLGSRGPPLAA
ncbi:DUF2946 family protein [Luteimonas fraxinea]|uniref:DUF2946 family protein n=1 Tax=Luteimonas fraxinea TaxID=2901869 RepID=A0ABS8UEH3_9GAMM|nr:DUF2946 family protein [Luteimonas fraxinea]MCD9097295.1 DUF2946 family protein [Luteimonas fraxinea]MCD9125140.1 DUF2946 family protein [Luteimonas fraxinea]UHH11557.1 DUF2946 family protein [Luteimonas fraxinea]